VNLNPSRGRRRRARALPGALLVVSMAIVVAMVGAATASAAKQATVCPSGCAFTTIAAALAAAEDGDRITIAPGTYAGGFTIAKSVKLKGAGADETTIEGGGPVVTVAEGVDVEIVHLAITGGGGGDQSSQEGGGIRNAGELTLKDVVVAGNVASFLSGEGFGGGIYNGPTGDLTVTGSTIRENTAASGFGGGIYNEGIAKVRTTSIVGNGARTGGGVFGGSGAAETAIVTSRVADNFAEGGGGIAGDDLQVTGSLVTGNSAAVGAGFSGNGVIRATVFTGNRAAVFGGGLSVFGPVDLRGSIVTGNTAGAQGGGIFIGVPGALEVRRSLIAGNTPDDCVGC
jgi:hypothetical protein